MLLSFVLYQYALFSNPYAFIRPYENFVICSCGAILAPCGASFDFVVIYSFGMSLAPDGAIFIPPEYK